MIENNTPLSMLEVQEYLKENGDNEEVIKFIKNFTKMKVKDAHELKEKLEKLELMKMKQDHIAKIIDLMPRDNEELNKIFTGVSLDEDETKKILDTIKEYK